MAKPCAWCGKRIGDTDRICPACLSAQPNTGSGSPAPPAAFVPAPSPPPGAMPHGAMPVGATPPPAMPPGAMPAGAMPPGAMPPPYPHPGQPAPAAGSNTGRIVAIVIGASVAAVLGIAVVSILAITFLGRQASSEFTAVGPEAAYGTGRDYPAEVRRNFMSACSVNSPQPVCSCALEEIEEEYTLDQFADLERQLADRGGQLTPTLQSIVVRCASGG